MDIKAVEGVCLDDGQFGQDFHIFRWDIAKKKGRVEGQAQEGWLLLDYGDVVVHLFSPDQREHYDLEELWSDGKVLLRVQ